MENYNGEKFLNKLYKDLFLSEEVKHLRKNNDSKSKSIRKYLDRIEKIYNMANTEHKKNLLKELYYKKYVIKKENINNYYSNDKKLEIINNQKESISNWLDYLMNEKNQYPMWTKYWAFQGILKMGEYDEVSNSYQERNESTIDKFVDVNYEVINNCIENILKLVGKEEIKDNEINKIIKTGSFNKLYTLFENRYKKENNELRKITNGKWIKYNQYSEEDAIKLYETLKNNNIGWSIADLNNAKEQLCGNGSGDFYVYYTMDKNNNYSFPRIYIKMYKNDRIKSIKGIEEFQNIEEAMEPILEEQLNKMTFVNKNDIKENNKKLSELKELSIINKKVNNNIELTTEEISNLYSKMYGFGFENDSRIKKIIDKRDNNKDFEKIKNIVKINGVFYDNFLNLKPGVKISNYDIIEELHDYYFIDSDLEMFMSKIDDKILDNEDFFFHTVIKYTDVLKYASDRLKNDKDFIMRIVAFDGYALGGVPEKYREDEKVIFEAINPNHSQDDSDAIQFVSDRLWEDKKFMLKALKYNLSILHFINDKFKDDEDVILFAAKQDAEYAFQNASIRLKNDKSFFKKINRLLVKQGKEPLEYKIYKEYKKPTYIDTEYFEDDEEEIIDFYDDEYYDDEYYEDEYYEDLADDENENNKTKHI